MVFSKFNSGRLLALALLLVLGLAGGPAAVWAEENFANERPLTQADIDGYIHLTPRLLGQAAQDPVIAAGLLNEAGLSRRRAVYVGAKIAVAQAMVTGALDPGQLSEKGVPLYLQPSADELSLIQKNLTSLTQAQAEARRVASGM